MQHKLVRVKNVISLSKAYEESIGSNSDVPKMGLLYAPPGFGKTTAATWLVTKENGIYVRAAATWTLTEMMTAILKELSLEPLNLPSKMLEPIVEQMKALDRPLFVDESDYLLRNPRMLEVARDIHDLSKKPVWFISADGLEKKIVNRAKISDRISQWVQFHKLDSSDAKKVADELCEVKVSDDLIELLHSKANGSIRRVTVGLSRIESFAKSRAMDSIDAKEWGEKPFFLTKELKNDA
ncbi:MAG: ATP-binding protein [Oscillatoriophycideae cyanobacterium NC_groundwater_1537_Pr4_S-0.65um_50_18]|nr:ATP-binding protein [Oscillatoriophycideae cyanobacterium NC_groundwater_1537_Pr4_S-0.65um_50_18]